MTVPPHAENPPAESPPAIPPPPVDPPAILPLPRRHRLVFWTAVVAALAAIGGGGYLAATKYVDNTAPATAVTGYFEALAAGDASGALAYGDIPDGDDQLLTDEVLETQLGIAPISGFAVTGTSVSGNTASVAVTYRLGFAGDPQAVQDTVTLDKDGSTWRLAVVAVPVWLRLAEATGRATLAGAAIPTATKLIFPGAVPITFDTDALALTPETRAVSFGGGGAGDRRATLSEAGRAAIGTGLDDAITACLDGSADDPTLCPTPDDTRAVPGTLRGTMDSPASEVAVLTLEGSADGIVHIGGQVSITGDYQQLDFNNQQVKKTGSTEVTLVGISYVTDPSTIIWQSL
jgi:hypothetical protein